MTTPPPIDESARRAILQLAYWNLERGHLHKSEALTRGLLSLDATDGSAWYYLGESLWRRGRLSDAAQALTQATRHGDRRPQTWLALAEVQVICSEPDAARHAITELCRLVPRDDPRAKRALALLRCCPAPFVAS
ncbi:tetratricopeptide repeat protein [Lujinxingia vulgaris]|uniref:Tetratricopeptide repeat protein n=1 Tax=Lujinxingia vulgaris TaxID=2600176 RepID=A0A5C6XFS8_9DELT|nr:tetratricopeptide repeat protein [Lujinxingia vulgaris]TXD41644.1 tetratricopeptide repeat protein [Lujinxingia vulgaris]